MNLFNRSPGAPDSPCRGCKDRQLGCHAVCRVYKEYAGKVRERNDELRAKSFTATSTRPEARVNERERKRSRKKQLLER